ncbi:chemotaxis protein CheW [Pontibacterium sp.]|uniref:chemotaxis protein CheW n=1 Tax=Pontibacterium sp. TaxID=2036026 RepID=UPI003513F13A
MSKSEQDNEFYAPKTGNQQVVFDYLESLLEDPDTLAHDTMEELKAIGALERAEPQAKPVVEDIPPEETESDEAFSEAPVFEESVAAEDELSQAVVPEIEDAAVDPEPEQLLEEELLEPEAFSEPELSFEELELVVTPADLMGEETDVTADTQLIDFEPETELQPECQEEPALEEVVLDEPEVFSEPDVPQPVLENVSAVADPTVPAPDITPEPVQEAAPVAVPAVDNTPKPALHVAEDVLNCILFQLQGLTLAIPVDDVEGAVSMERLTLHFDMDHDWVLGFFNAMGKETSVVDTGNWLLPGRFDASQANYEEVLILKGRRWALACDTLVKSMRMQHSDIVWAGENKSRPWLLGTNMAERCAILDVDKLQILLNQQA